MAHQEMSWERSNAKRVFFSLILLLVPAFLVSMESQKEWYEQPDSVLEDTFVDGTSLLEMKQVFETAPEMVKDCVRHLQDPNFYHSPGYRFLMLYGEPGTGKTTLAKAIAQYAQWDQVFYTPADIQTGERNEAAKKLRDVVDGILRRCIPTVLILDEINQLLENAESKHHDNDATSKEFWTAMDKIHGIHEFFIIGTANRIHKIPKQIKSRIKSHSCEIELSEKIEEKKKILLCKLNTTYTKVDQNCDAYLTEILKDEDNKHWTGRDYAELSEMCKMVFREKDKKSSPMIFAKEIIAEAIQRSKRYEEKSVYNKKEMTDEERQDLYQAQNMQLQLLIQRHQKHPALGLRTPGLRSDDANTIYELVATKEQKRLMNENLKMDKVKDTRLI